MTNELTLPVFQPRHVCLCDCLIWHGDHWERHQYCVVWSRHYPQYNSVDLIEHLRHVSSYLFTPHWWKVRWSFHKTFLELHSKKEKCCSFLLNNWSSWRLVLNVRREKEFVSLYSLRKFLWNKVPLGPPEGAWLQDAIINYQVMMYYSWLNNSEVYKVIIYVLPSLPATTLKSCSHINALIIIMYNYNHVFPVNWSL